MCRRMFSSLVTGIATVLLVAMPAVVYAQSNDQRPRVLVVPLVNETGQSENDALADTTTDTIQLTIRLLDRYQVLSWDGSAAGPERASPSAAAEIAQRQGADSVLFGRVTRGDTGVFQFSLSVFDRAENRVTSTNETASPTLFGVFDAADELVANAVSAFSGQRVGFGRIRFQPEEQLSYRVFVDGSAVGDNVTSVERILIGDRQIEIAELVDGQERLIYTEAVEVQEGQAVRISFSVPDATPQEIARASEIVARVRRNLDAGLHIAHIREDVGALRSLAAIAPSAISDGPGTVELLERRTAIVADLERLTTMDFRAMADGAEEETIDDVRQVIERLENIYEPWVEAASTGDPTLLNDARRNARVALELMILEREAVQAEENAELILRLNRMIRRSHFYFARENLFDETLSSWESTTRTQQFLGEYDRAVERRRPFWHWLAGTVGVAGLGAAGYIQFGGLYDDALSARDDALVTYDNAGTTQAAIDARGELETAQDELDLMAIGSIVGAGVGVFLPVAILGRINSVRRPGRVWQDYNEEPFRTQRRAVAIDYRARSWQQDTSAALLILGDSEAVSGPGIEPGATTPVFLSTPPGESILVTHETAGSDQPSEYAVDIPTGLTVLYLGAVE